MAPGGSATRKLSRNGLVGSFERKVTGGAPLTKNENYEFDPVPQLQSHLPDIHHLVLGNSSISEETFADGLARTLLPHIATNNDGPKSDLPPTVTNLMESGLKRFISSA
jgi:hypothetical protein